MTPQQWIEGTKKPAYIDDTIHGTQNDSVYGFKYPFIQEGVRLMTTLTEEIAYVRTIMEASEAECRRREEQDLVWRTKYTILENELAALKAECVKQISLRILADIEVRLLRGPAQASVRRGGPSMKPHVFAKMVNEVRDLAKQYGHMEQFRCRVADLLKEYITVEHGKGIHGASR